MGNTELLGSTRVLSTATSAVGRIVHRRADPNNGDNHIDIVFDKSLFGGNWKIHLTSATATPVPFHAWIERDNGVRSRFSLTDSDASHTLGSLSCGHRTIAVGSYLSGLPGRQISSFSAEGPTRDGRQKPEVSAPGQFLQTLGIRSASSLSQGTTRKPGTSMAAPHVAGLVALLMEAAGRVLTNDEIRAAVIATARDHPPGGGGWDPRYGFGRIDALQAIRHVLPLSSPVPASSASELVANDAEPLSAGTVTDIISVATAEARRSNVRVKIQIEVEPV
ncbi:MAG: subtilisin family serine protease [Planctomycetaceae bacterium]|jgi:subtilisin family serine protease